MRSGGDAPRHGAHSAIAATTASSPAAIQPRVPVRDRDGDRRLVIQQLPDVADVAQSPSWILLQAALEQSPHVRRHAVPARLGLDHRRQDRRHVLAVERASARQHLVEHDAERPDVGALVDRLAARLLGRHVGGRAENHAHLRRRRRRDRRRVRETLVALDAPAGSIAFARPKSSTFTVPSARTLMFAGFRSRWMMPCSCAASSASAICFAIGSASSSGIGAARDALRQVLALDEFHHERAHAAGFFEAVDVRDVRMVQRRERLRFAREPREPVGVAGDRESGRTLDRDLAIQLRVARAIDLAHPADADAGDDFIDAETGAGSEGQV